MDMPELSTVANSPTSSDSYKSSNVLFSKETLQKHFNSAWKTSFDFHNDLLKLWSLDEFIKAHEDPANPGALDRLWIPTELDSKDGAKWVQDIPFKVDLGVYRLPERQVGCKIYLFKSGGEGGRLGFWVM
jgi:hypothetical protein